MYNGQHERNNMVEHRIWENEDSQGNMEKIIFLVDYRKIWKNTNMGGWDSGKKIVILMRNLLKEMLQGVEEIILKKCESEE